MGYRNDIGSRDDVDSEESYIEWLRLAAKQNNNANVTWQIWAQATNIRFRGQYTAHVAGIC